MNKKTFKVKAVLAMSLAVGLATPTFAQDEPKLGGTYEFAVTLGDPDTFDCHATNSIASLYRLAPSYSTLLEFDPNNYPEIVGDVAEDWSVSDDGLTYTFNIRKGVMFHNGTELTAKDVVASYEHLRAPKEGVVSVRQGQFSNIDTITMPDDYTVVMTMKAANASMPDIFAGPYNCIYSADLLESDPDYPARTVMGTGPFVFDSYSPGAEYRVKKSDSYFMEGLPRVDEVVMRNMPTPAAVNAMSAGQIPGIFPSLSQADVDRIAGARGDEVVTYDPIVTTVMFMVTINTQVAPFDDVRVRQALNLAIDRRAGSAALSKIASASGFGTLMRPGSQWARDGEELDALPGFEPDIEARREQARALLAEAGQSDLSFTFLNWNRYTPLGVFLIDQWRQIGVTVDQEALETAAFFGKTKAGDYVAMLDAIAEPSDDPTLRFGKMVSYSENPSNLARIDDPEFDRIYEAQGVELDTDKRIELVQELEDHMLDMAYAVPLMWSVRPMVMDAKIKGLLTPYIASNYVGLDNATIWIDE